MVLLALASAVPAKPSPPFLLDATGREMVVGFSAVGGATGYVVRFGPDPTLNFVFVHPDSGPSLNRTFSSLTPGAEFYGTVQASAGGELGPVSDRGGPWLAPRRKPQAPAAPTFASATSDSLTITHVVPPPGDARLQEAVVTGYKVYVSTSSDMSNPTVLTKSLVHAGTGDLPVPILVPSLLFNTAYFFTTQYTTNSVLDEDSAVSAVGGPFTTLGLPEAPGQPFPVQAYFDSLHVGWTAPAPRGATITGYRLRVATSLSMAGAQTYTSMSTTELTFVIPSLAQATEYFVDVAAISSPSTGSDSAPSAVRGPLRTLTRADSPSAPTAANGLYSRTRDSIVVKLQATSGSVPASGYEVRISTSSTMANPVVHSDLTISSLRTFGGLSEGATYYFDVRALVADTSLYQSSAYSAVSSPLSTISATLSNAFLGTGLQVPSVPVLPSSLVAHATVSSAGVSSTEVTVTAGTLGSGSLFWSVVPAASASSLTAADVMAGTGSLCTATSTPTQPFSWVTQVLSGCSLSAGTSYAVVGYITDASNGNGEMSSQTFTVPDVTFSSGVVLKPWTSTYSVVASYTVTSSGGSAFTWGRLLPAAEAGNLTASQLVATAASSGCGWAAQSVSSGTAQDHDMNSCKLSPLTAYALLVYADATSSGTGTGALSYVTFVTPSLYLNSVVLDPGLAVTPAFSPELAEFDAGSVNNTLESIVLTVTFDVAATARLGASSLTSNSAVTLSLDVGVNQIKIFTTVLGVTRQWLLAIFRRPSSQSNGAAAATLALSSAFPVGSAEITYRTTLQADVSSALSTALGVQVDASQVAISGFQSGSVVADILVKPPAPPRGVTGHDPAAIVQELTAQASTSGSALLAGTVTQDLTGISATSVKPVELCADDIWQLKGQCGPAGVKCGGTASVCSNGGKCSLDSQTGAVRCDACAGFSGTLCEVEIGRMANNSLSVSGTPATAPWYLGSVATGSVQAPYGRVVAAGNVLQLQANLAGADQVEVFLGPTSDPLRFACPLVSVPSVISSATTGRVGTAAAEVLHTLQCTAPSGYGARLRVTLRLRDARTGATFLRPGSGNEVDTLTFSPPTITTGTLLREGFPADVVDGVAVVQAPSLLGGTVEFDGTGFLGSDLRVEYSNGLDDTGSGADGGLCVPHPGRANPSTHMICDMSPGLGKNYTFVVVVGGLPSLRGRDVFNFPTPPKIVRVTGCESSDPITGVTQGCPTSGLDANGQPVILTMIGEDMRPPMSFLVGGQECTVPTAVPGAPSGTQVTCRLPRGKGFTQIVVGLRKETMSFPAGLVSYARPTITSVVGCTPDPSSAVRIIDCNRYGGDVITVTGQNFGLGAPLVLIGADLCTNVTVLQEHTQFTCVLPSGAQLRRAIVIKQEQGEVNLAGTVTNDSATVSHVQCQRGWRDQNLDCVQCTPGRFTPATSQPSCRVCSQGTKAADVGRSFCDECTPGFFQANEESVKCDSCVAGFFTSSFGQGACQTCLGGKYSTTDNATICLSCEAGKFSRDASTTCLSCLPGKYAPQPSSKECIDTQPGTVTAQLSTVIPDACPPGTHQPAANQTACQYCQPGKYNNRSGQPLCLDCADDFFVEQTGALSCRRCPPFGSDCQKPRMRMLRNYWVFNDTFGELQSHMCPEQACLGHDCAINRLAFDDPNNRLCGHCIDGFSKWGGTCVDCTGGWRLDMLLLYLFQSMFSVLVLHRFSQPREVINAQWSYNSETVLKIFFYYSQIGLLMLGLSVPDWMSWLHYFSFQIGLATESGEFCYMPLSDYQHLWLEWSLPFIMWAWITLFYGISSWFHRHFRREAAGTVQDAYARTAINIYLFTYSEVALFCFRYLDCVTVQGEDIMFSKPAVSCTDTRYLELRPLVLIQMVVLVFTVPAVVYAVIKIYTSGHRDIRRNRVAHAHLHAFFHYLYKPYHGNAYYWEAVVLMRRGLYAAAAVWFAQDPAQRFLVFMILGLFALSFHYVIRPPKPLRLKNVPDFTELRERSARDPLLKGIISHEEEERVDALRALRAKPKEFHTKRGTPYTHFGTSDNLHTSTHNWIESPLETHESTTLLPTSTNGTTVAITNGTTGSSTTDLAHSSSAPFLQPVGEYDSDDNHDPREQGAGGRNGSEASGGASPLDAVRRKADQLLHMAGGGAKPAGLLSDNEELEEKADSDADVEEESDNEVNVELQDDDNDDEKDSSPSASPARPPRRGSVEWFKRLKQAEKIAFEQSLGIRRNDFNKQPLSRKHNNKASQDLEVLQQQLHAQRHGHGQGRESPSEEDGSMELAQRPVALIWRLPADNDSPESSYATPELSEPESEDELDLALLPPPAAPPGISEEALREHQAAVRRRKIEERKSKRRKYLRKLFTMKPVEVDGKAGWYSFGSSRFQGVERQDGLHIRSGGGFAKEPVFVEKNLNKEARKMGIKPEEVRAAFDHYPSPPLSPMPQLREPSAAPTPEPVTPPPLEDPVHRARRLFKKNMQRQWELRVEASRPPQIGSQWRKEPRVPPPSPRETDKPVPVGMAQQNSQEWHATESLRRNRALSATDSPGQHRHVRRASLKKANDQKMALLGDLKEEEEDSEAEEEEERKRLFALLDDAPVLAASQAQPVKRTGSARHRRTRTHGAVRFNTELLSPGALALQARSVESEQEIAFHQLPLYEERVMLEPAVPEADEWADSTDEEVPEDDGWEPEWKANWAFHNTIAKKGVDKSHGPFRHAIENYLETTCMLGLTVMAAVRTNFQPPFSSAVNWAIGMVLAIPSVSLLALSAYHPETVTTFWRVLRKTPRQVAAKLGACWQSLSDACFKCCCRAREDRALLERRVSAAAAVKSVMDSGPLRTIVYQHPRLSAFGMADSADVQQEDPMLWNPHFTSMSMVDVMSGMGVVPAAQGDASGADSATSTPLTAIAAAYAVTDSNRQTPSTSSIDNINNKVSPAFKRASRQMAWQNHQSSLVASMNALDKATSALARVGGAEPTGADGVHPAVSSQPGGRGFNASVAASAETGAAGARDIDESPDMTLRAPNVSAMLRTLSGVDANAAHDDAAEHSVSDLSYSGMPASPLSDSD